MRTAALTIVITDLVRENYLAGLRAQGPVVQLLFVTTAVFCILCLHLCRPLLHRPTHFRQPDY